MEGFCSPGDTPLALYMPMMKALPEDEDDTSYRHRGVLSTDERDQDGEYALQEQMDMSYFLSKGFFNWNHRPGPENVIGEPTEARVTVLGDVDFYTLKPGQTGHEHCVAVKGVLYKGVTQADATWNLMKTLAKGGHRRTLGYSVQGGITARRGNVLAKSYVRHAAITHEPVNASTLASMAKSLGADYADITPSDCQSFECLTTFAKSLLARNNDTTAPGVKQMVRMTLGMTSCAMNHHNGTEYTRGRDSMLDHLCKCVGWREQDANDYLLMLHRNIR